MGLDMYLEASFSTRACVPTDADYEAMREGEEVKLENLQNLKMLSHLLALKTLQYKYQWNHF